MIGYTPAELDIRDRAAPPAQIQCVSVLAEVGMYFEEHPGGRPPVNAVLSLKAPAGLTPAERVEWVQEMAGWLGVAKTERYGTHFAQRLFTDERGGRIVVEAHATPDRDAAFALQQAASAGAEPAAVSA